MSTIPAQTIVTVIVGDAQTVAAYSNALSANDILSAVSGYLNSLGGKYQVEDSGASGAITSTVLPWIQETFQATFKIQIQWDTDSQELVNDIEAAFQEVTLQTPTNITIPTIGQVTPGSTLNQSIASGAGSVINAPGQLVSGVADQVQKALSSLTSTAKSLLIGLAAIVIIALVLIAYGPNVQHIAGAI